MAEPAIAWKLGHAFSAIVTLLMMLCFFIYLLVNSTKRRNPYKYGPLAFATAALILVPIIPVWKFAADLHIVSIDSIWEHGCDDDNAFL